MSKKLLVIAPTSLPTLSMSWMVVNVNTADYVGLEALSGIGPKCSGLAIEERIKNGPYKDATDFKTRVSGIGGKTLAKLEDEGLMFGASVLAPAVKKDGKDAKKK